MKPRGEKISHGHEQLVGSPLFALPALLLSGPHSLHTHRHFTFVGRAMGLLQGFCRAFARRVAVAAGLILRGAGPESFPSRTVYMRASTHCSRAEADIAKGPYTCHSSAPGGTNN